MENLTWKETNAPIMSKGRTDDIWFSDENIGWAVNSNGQILSTIDGGHNWSEQLRLPDVYLRCISFSDKTHGWVGTLTASNRLFKTIDGGENWIKIENLPKNPSAICGICAVSNDVIFAAGTNYPNRSCAVLKSIDSGKSWISIDMSHYANLLVDIFFINETKQLVGLLVDLGAQLGIRSNPLSCIQRIVVTLGLIRLADKLMPFHLVNGGGRFSLLTRCADLFHLKTLKKVQY
jgi:hypothetical protein